MKVIFNDQDRFTPLNELKAGDVFSYEGYTYLYLGEQAKTVGGFTAKEYQYNAVRLKDGGLKELAKTTSVLSQPNAALYITEFCNDVDNVQKIDVSNDTCILSDNTVASYSISSDLSWTPDACCRTL